MKKKSLDKIVFNIIGYTFMTILTLLCVSVFVMLVSGSFTSESYIVNKGYSIIPHELSLGAYKTIFANPKGILSSYGVTIFTTVVGTFCSLFMQTMTAYVLSRKDFEWRNKIAFYFYFTTLFTGGLTASYIWNITIGMRNNICALIVPGFMNVFNMFIIRNCMSAIPYEVTESAKIDGASDFKIYLSLILPMSTAALATVGLFTALAYWNGWMNSMLYMDNPYRQSLQYYLYKMLNSAEAMRELSQSGSSHTLDIPMESTKLAMTVVAAGPMLLLYPFVQRFFVQGITVGAVKG